MDSNCYERARGRCISLEHPTGENLQHATDETQEYPLCPV